MQVFVGAKRTARWLGLKENGLSPQEKLLCRLLYAFTYNRNITHNFICINIHFYIFALNNCKSI